MTQNSNIRQRIGQVVRALRKSKELSQADLGKIAYCHRNTISSLELGKCSELTFLEHLADIFGVKLSDIFKMSEDLA